MSYLELINEFWKLDMIKPFSAIETKMYMMILNESNIRMWVNPIELRTSYLEDRLRTNRKTIMAARNELKRRGLLEFVSQHKNATIYILANVEINNTELYDKSEILCNDEIENLSKNGLKETQTEHKSNTKVTQEKHKSNTKETQNALNIEDIRLKTKEKERLSKESPKKTKKLSAKEQLSNFRQESQNESYVNFLNWLETNAPYVACNINPLSEEEFVKLKMAYGSTSISSNILALENRKDLRKKYVSLYRTLINWCKNGYNE